MESNERLVGWEEARIAERMSFSSFSRCVDDIWAHDVLRPFQIVLMPGYRVPGTLDRGDKDAMWYRKDDVDSPVIVWDGYCPTALHEIIRECFDYDGTNPYILVRDAKAKQVVPDRRDPVIMKMRPRRQSGWGPRAIRNHIVQLKYWADLLPQGDPTGHIYSDMLTGGGDGAEAPDSLARSLLFAERGLWKADLFVMQRDIFKEYEDRGVAFRSVTCDRGELPDKDSERAKRDAQVPRLDMTFHATNHMSSLSLDDFPDREAPASYYRAAVAKGQFELEQRQRKSAAFNRPARKVTEEDFAPRTPPTAPIDKDNPF